VNRATRQRRERALLAEQHRFERRVVGDHRDKDLGAARGRAGRVRDHGVERLELICAGAGATLEVLA